MCTENNNQCYFQFYLLNMLSVEKIEQLYVRYHDSITQPINRMIKQFIPGSKRHPDDLDQILPLLPYQIIDLINQFLVFNGKQIAHTIVERICCIATKHFTETQMTFFCTGILHKHVETFYGYNELIRCDVNGTDLKLSTHDGLLREGSEVLVMNNGNIVIYWNNLLQIYNPVTKSIVYKMKYMSNVMPLFDTVSGRLFFVVRNGTNPLISFHKNDTVFKGKRVHIQNESPDQQRDHDHDHAVHIQNESPDQQRDHDHDQLLIDIPFGYRTGHQDRLNIFSELPDSKFIVKAYGKLYICDSMENNNDCILVKYLDWLDVNQLIGGFITYGYLLIYYDTQYKLLFADLLTKTNLHHVAISGQCVQMMKISDNLAGFIVLEQTDYVVYTIDILTLRVEKLYQTDSLIQFIGCIDNWIKSIVIKQLVPGMFNNPYMIHIINLTSKKEYYTFENNDDLKYITVAGNKLISVSKHPTMESSLHKNQHIVISDDPRLNKPPHVSVISIFE
jgi:hypothetical protein